MANKKKISEQIKKQRQYTLMKGALLDVSAYVHGGVGIDIVEEIIKSVLMTDKNSFAKSVPTFLAYHIQTNYEKDEDVIELMDKVVGALDAELVKVSYDEIKSKIN